MAMALPIALGSTETDALTREDFVCRVPLASTQDFDEDDSVVLRLKGFAPKRGP